MTVRDVNPLDRKQVPAARAYRPGDRVWVHRHGGWLPGLVRDAHETVLVSYHVAEQRGVLTDTVPALYVVPRKEHDPLLDANASSTVAMPPAAGSPALPGVEEGGP